MSSYYIIQVGNLFLEKYFFISENEKTVQFINSSEGAMRFLSRTNYEFEKVFDFLCESGLLIKVIKVTVTFETELREVK